MAILKTIISLPGRLKGDKKKEQASATAKGMRGCEFIDLQDRMLAGVLYSVSHNIFGEIFPVYVGRNTIGSAEDRDICLRENSVDETHAVLLVRRVETADGELKMTISIADDTPGCEIYVNGERQGFERIYCNNHDTIGIGPHYRLKLCILTPEACGLSTDPEFVALKPIERQSGSTTVIDAGNDAPAVDNTRYRDSIAEEDERSFYAPTKGRVAGNTTNQTIIEK